MGFPAQSAVQDARREFLSQGRRPGMAFWSLIRHASLGSKRWPLHSNATAPNTSQRSPVRKDSPSCTGELMNQSLLLSPRQTDSREKNSSRNSSRIGQQHSSRNSSRRNSSRDRGRSRMGGDRHSSRMMHSSRMNSSRMDSRMMHSSSRSSRNSSRIHRRGQVRDCERPGWWWGQGGPRMQTALVSHRIGGFNKVSRSVWGLK